MQAAKCSDMLLFSKELAGWRRYLLYFVKSSELGNPSARLYRYRVAWKHQFDDFALGGIYSLSNRIGESAPTFAKIAMPFQVQSIFSHQAAGFAVFKRGGKEAHRY